MTLSPVVVMLPDGRSFWDSNASHLVTVMSCRRVKHWELSPRVRRIQRSTCPSTLPDLSAGRERRACVRSVSVDPQVRRAGECHPEVRYVQCLREL